ncbi:hypothetical protein Xhom_04729 [Xenorhabdus hominickii]|uniref:Uncharacterized protein n=2 Tax=Xenorhabdus hominickii TaxID=351679 RepID=A0A1V0M4M6_XENHO|nr:hypothetical protein [Xenorhabdus hominickii]PHM51890.1 hypothetical protein Xhom_04729 [Xenorhabdus hominickii]
MITIAQANAINGIIRGHFFWGHKSDNKVYLSDYGTASNVQKTYRNEQAREANKSIWIQRTAGFTFADKMNMLPYERAGNCGEYTEHAVNLALAMDQVSTVWTFGCSEPGGINHIFCVFNLHQAPNNITCLEEMSSDNSRPDVIVCDPWANIVCLYTDYPIRLRDKMAKWNMSGKSIKLGISSISAIAWGNRCLNAPAYFEQKR